MISSHSRAELRAGVLLDIIAHIVSDTTGVPVDDIRANSRKHDATKARYLFVELCNGVINPAGLIGDYLDKNNSMIAYYKHSYQDLYATNKRFREMSDKADARFNEILTKINATIKHVFQEEGEQVQC